MDPGPDVKLNMTANVANTNTARELRKNITASKKSIYRDTQNNGNSRIKK